MCPQYVTVSESGERHEALVFSRYEEQRDVPHGPDHPEHQAAQPGSRLAPPAGPGCIRASRVLPVRRRERSSPVDTVGGDPYGRQEHLQARRSPELRQYPRQPGGSAKHQRGRKPRIPPKTKIQQAAQVLANGAFAARMPADSRTLLLRVRRYPEWSPVQ